MLIFGYSIINWIAIIIVLAAIPIIYLSLREDGPRNDKRTRLDYYVSRRPTLDDVRRETARRRNGRAR